MGKKKSHGVANPEEFLGGLVSGENNRGRLRSGLGRFCELSRDGGESGPPPQCMVAIEMRIGGEEIASAREMVKECMSGKRLLGE